MKSTLLLLSVILYSFTASAQENTSTISQNKVDQQTIKEATCNIADVDSKTICYGETSKVAFYEALIAKNEFNISLKESRGTSTATKLKLSNKKNEVLYAHR